MKLKQIDTYFKMYEITNDLRWWRRGVELLEAEKSRIASLREFITKRDRMYTSDKKAA